MGYWDVAKGNQIVKFALFLTSTKMKRSAPDEEMGPGPEPKQAKKLLEKGIQWNVREWIKSYLTHRT